LRPADLSQLKAADACERLPSARGIQPKARLSGSAPTHGRTVVELDFETYRLDRRATPSVLRVEAEKTLQRLEQLSPAVAQQCRQAFPELVGN